jgi:hypothetical protein
MRFAALRQPAQLRAWRAMLLRSLDPSRRSAGGSVIGLPWSPGVAEPFDLPITILADDRRQALWMHQRDAVTHRS